MEREAESVPDRVWIGNLSWLGAASQLPAFFVNLGGGVVEPSGLWAKCRRPDTRISLTG